MAKRQSTASNFGALIQAHRESKHSDVEVPKSLDASPILAKSRDPGYVKLTAYVPRELHMDLMLRVIKEGREISYLITELVTDWLKKEEEK